MTASCPLCGGSLSQPFADCPSCASAPSAPSTASSVDLLFAGDNVIIPQTAPDKEELTASTAPKVLADPARESVPQPTPPDTTDEHCIKCNQHREGKGYFFFVRTLRDSPEVIRHREGVFLCNTCARNMLGLNPNWLWVKLLFVSLIGGIALLVVFLRLRLICFPITILMITFGVLASTWRKLSYVESEKYLVDPKAEHMLTRMVIQIRKAEVLKKLGMPSSEVLFVAQCERKL